MKKSIFVLLILFPTLLWADYWDNLTLVQAEEVIEFLNSNPYILDYCDCCDYEGEYATKIYLMKVESTEIITCDWDSRYFSVKAQVEVLAEIPYNKEGPDIYSPQLFSFEKKITITMNYTWAYNTKQSKAAPLYTIIPYDIYGEQKSDSGYCREFIAFPSPMHVINEAYGKWYNERF